jgi:hypothetical protein
MKKRRFLFVGFSFGALTLRLCSADEPSKAPPQPHAYDKHNINAHSAEPPHVNGDQIAQKHFLLNGVGHDSNGSSRAASTHSPTKSTTSNEFHPSPLKKTAPAANQPFVMNKTATYQTPPARSPEGREIAAPFPRAVPGRAATAASLGGLAASSAKNSAAALNGTAMKHTP